MKATGIIRRIDNLGRVVIQNDRRQVGEAKCSPDDTFNPAIGMVVAFCRASGKSIPIEVTDEYC